MLAQSRDRRFIENYVFRSFLHVGIRGELVHATRRVSGLETPEDDPRCTAVDPVAVHARDHFRTPPRRRGPLEYKEDRDSTSGTVTASRWTSSGRRLARVT